MGAQQLKQKCAGEDLSVSNDYFSRPRNRGALYFNCFYTLYIFIYIIVYLFNSIGQSPIFKPRVQLIVFLFSFLPQVSSLLLPALPIDHVSTGCKQIWIPRQRYSRARERGSPSPRTGGPAPFVRGTPVFIMVY